MFDFYKNKRVLITGHTGFKGSWLSVMLQKMGAKVKGISLYNSSEHYFYDNLNLKNLIFSEYIDIRDYNSFKAAIINFDPEYIFHFAAQSLVIDGYENPINTFSTNVMGTQNLLDVLRVNNLSPTVIITTTDKVYQNNGTGVPFKESDPLGGSDPYSASKAAKEHVIKSYFESYFKDREINIGVVRAGNVIGGGDWSNNRLIPDIIRAIRGNTELKIRYPHATRPWQHVLEPLMGYLNFSIWLSSINNPNFEILNFGPESGQVNSVIEIVNEMKKYFPSLNVEIHENKFKEASSLTLDIKKAKDLINFQPKLDFSHTISMTSNWYLKQLEGKNALDLCLDNIYEYNRL